MDSFRKHCMTLEEPREVGKRGGREYEDEAGLGAGVVTRRGVAEDEARGIVPFKSSG